MAIHKFESVTKDAPFAGLHVEKSPEGYRLLQSFAPAYMRWMATRFANPFIASENATGLEGYWVGTTHYPQVVANDIAKLGVDQLASLKRFHPHDFTYMNKVWKVLRGELLDVQIMEELSATLGAVLGRLRMKVYPTLNPTGDQFRRDVAKAVEFQPKIVFHRDEIDQIVGHTIALPVDAQPGVTAVEPDKNLEGYAFMNLLARIGYPGVRAVVQRMRN